MIDALCAFFLRGVALILASAVFIASMALYALLTGIEFAARLLSDRENNDTST